MEVLTVESQTFQDMQSMFQSVCQIAKELASENKELKAKLWITAREVGTLTGYNEKTIKNRKKEIGFRSDGGLLLFKTKDVIAWMDRGYIAPR